MKLPRILVAAAILAGLIGGYLLVRLSGDANPETAAETADCGSATSGDPPDIILIILDAARADRFSFAGNDRLTTPFIDGLALESLVFANAYSLAPYTLCSVPTMITGLSFLDHGVVGHEDVLSHEAITLAESLLAVGYRTACFSATPNNSRAKGFDQGYEVFREIWTEGPQRTTRRAHHLAEQVIQWLDDPALDDRPLHLQIHLLPPHAPYDPPAPFDLFSDLAYDGPCDGYQRTLGPLDHGELDPNPACIAHLVDLYDGNLRTADDATRLIVEALRHRPRWTNTVVLVTSDHGEAFMEHGRMEHNSTLYTEMLHVPFVLHVPAGINTGAVDTTGLVTLADITPTLLGLAGVPVHELVDGHDLLAAERDPEDRSMVMRTADASPVMGLRTLSWSLMIGSSGSGALFDLSVDPDELDNVHQVRTGRAEALTEILRERISLAPRLEASDRTAEVSEDERRLLEDLGYLEK